MNGHRRRRFPWERSRSAGNGSSSEQPPEYVHPLDMPPNGDDPAWEGPASDPFEAPQTTRLVPVGPAAPTTRRTEGADWSGDDEEPRSVDLDDAQAPVFAADTMRALEAPRPNERTSFVSHGSRRPHFASPDRQPTLRPPASVAGQRLGPTPPAGLFGPADARPSDAAGRERPAAASAAPPWVSTSRARAAAAAPASPADQSAQAEVVVRIELVIIDQTEQVAAARNAKAAAPEAAGSVDTAPQGEADAVDPEAAPAPGLPAPTPAVPAPARVPASTPTGRSSAPIRAVVRIVGVLALVGIGLFLVQLGVWLAR